MVTGEQNLRNCTALKLHRSGVLRKTEQAVMETILGQGLFFTQNSGNLPRNGIDQHRSGEGSHW